MTLSQMNAAGRRSTSNLAIAVVLFLGFVLTAALASTYLGHSSSPYGNCFGRSGRPAPCRVVARTLTAKDSAQLARALGPAMR